MTKHHSNIKNNQDQVNENIMNRKKHIKKYMFNVYICNVMYAMFEIKK